MPQRKNRKVLIVVENLPVPLDRRVWQEAHSLRSAGYKVVILCPRMKGFTKRKETIDGIVIYRHPMPSEAQGAAQYIYEYGSSVLWECLYSFFIFAKEGFRIIQICNPPDLLFIAALPYKLLAGVKIIFDHHDGSPEIWVAKGGAKDGLVYRTLIFLERITLKIADIVMTVNLPYRELAATRGRIDRGRIFVVRNSPKIAHAPPVSSVQDKEEITVGYIGVIGKQDGVENLLRTMRHIVETRGSKNIKMKIMGSGPELESIKSRAAAMGLSDYMTFVGWVTGDAYIDNLNSCDICVNADTINEYNEFCSPNKVYEYMFFGKPIVQFPMKENSYQAEGACLFARPNDYEDLGEKILQLAADKDLRRELGRRGKDRFNALFTWERSEAELLKAYAAAGT